MRILDKNDVEITNPDLDLGYLVEEQVFVQHHEAEAAVEEESHYEVIKYYPATGGQDVKKVIDVAAKPAVEAYDEYETISRYIEYTEEEYAALHANDNLPTAEERLSDAETALDASIEMIMELSVSVDEQAEQIATLETDVADLKSGTTTTESTTIDETTSSDDTTTTTE